MCQAKCGLSSRFSLATQTMREETKMAARETTMIQCVARNHVH